jgi:hypothetical protein
MHLQQFKKEMEYICLRFGSEKMKRENGENPLLFPQL